ncbi:MAG: type II toxin-antitoxin system YoeB family toxin [bacterium]
MPLHWSRSGIRVRDKIKTSIEDIQHHPFGGMGDPEPWKCNLRGFRTRRLSGKHRLARRIDPGALQIAQCRFRY